MLLWYAAGSVFGVANVFQSPGLDYRLVAIGALLPLALDLPFREQAYAHTLLVSTVLLAAVMIATSGRGKRLARRRLISLPIGAYCGLVLSAAWRSQEVFLWPAFGTDFPGVALLPPSAIAVVLEALGVLALVWIVRHGRLGDAERRRRFVRTGRIDFVAPEVGA
jgi:predicted Rdx family selenoprotein